MHSVAYLVSADRLQAAWRPLFTIVFVPALSGCSLSGLVRAVPHTRSVDPPSQIPFSIHEHIVTVHSAHKCVVSTA